MSLDCSRIFILGLLGLEWAKIGTDGLGHDTKIEVGELFYPMHPKPRQNKKHARETHKSKITKKSSTA